MLLSKAVAGLLPTTSPGMPSNAPSSLSPSQDGPHRLGVSRKGQIDECLTDDFGKLINLAGLTPELNAQLASNPIFVGNWGIKTQWKVTDRYGGKTEAEARGAGPLQLTMIRMDAEMDYELLVDEQIEDGKSLIAGLVENGFDVTVAFWVKTSEEGLWFLYIGSASVRNSSLADAYRVVYGALRRSLRAGSSLQHQTR